MPDHSLGTKSCSDSMCPVWPNLAVASKVYCKQMIMVAQGYNSTLTATIYLSQHYLTFLSH